MDIPQWSAPEVVVVLPQGVRFEALEAAWRALCLQKVVPPGPDVDWTAACNLHIQVLALADAEGMLGLAALVQATLEAQEVPADATVKQVYSGAAAFHQFATGVHPCILMGVLLSHRSPTCCSSATWRTTARAVWINS